MRYGREDIAIDDLYLARASNEFFTYHQSASPPALFLGQDKNLVLPVVRYLVPRPQSFTDAGHAIKITSLLSYELSNLLHQCHRSCKRRLHAHRHLPQEGLFRIVNASRNEQKSAVKALCAHVLLIRERSSI